MAASTPSVEPDEIVAGDTLKFEIELPDYKASDGWTLTYYLQNAAAALSFAASASGDKHLVNVDAATTAGWTTGEYHWNARVTKGAEAYTLRTGVIEVLGDLTSALDRRVHAEKVLDALDATIEGKATKDQASYSIAGRSLSRMGVEELLQWRDYYEAKVLRLRREDARARGKGQGNKVITRFSW